MAQELRITDATEAQKITEGILRALHGERLAEVNFTRTWYHSGRLRNMWEVEEVAVLKAGWGAKERIPFKYQLDPVSGDVVGYAT